MTPPAPPRWARWEAAGLAATLLVGALLRLNQYTLAPLPADNQDEVDWTWAGLGILTRGVPYGWSNLHAYGERISVAANGTTFEVAHPFLDHPPLFSIIVGLAAWLQGARQLGDVTISMVRPVPITLGVAALFLTYLLGRRLVGPPAAMAGTVLLATAPAAVLVQRQVEAESLLAPLFLLALIALHRRLSGDLRSRWVAVLLTCCLLAPLAKVSGVAIAGGLAAVLIAAGRWRLAVLTAGAGLLGIAGYFAYGIAYNADLFFKVLAESETHRYGVMGVYQFITASSGPSGAVRHLRDGWWLLGWLGVGAAVGRVRNLGQDLLLWPLAAYAVVIMLAAEGVQDYGWFRVAVYPLVYILAGWLTWVAISRPSALGLVAMIALGGATATTALFGDEGRWAPSAFVLLAGLVVAVAPALLTGAYPSSRRLSQVARAVAGLALILVVAANVATSAQLDRLYFHL
ncbi:MAG: glycosyltransferase family 39 protein [Candidatus Dormibacteria bacterium]